MVLGFIYEIKGKYPSAIDQYRRVTELDPLNKEAHIRLGQIYYKLGKLDNAIEQNQILMQLDVYSFEPYIRNFNIYVSVGAYGKAEEVLKSALRKDISDAIIYSSLGYLAAQRKDYSQAVEYYTIAAKKEPANNMYRFYLAASMDQTGERAKAVEMMEKIVSEDGNLPEVYNYLGYVYVEEGKDLDKAIALIKKALELDPENGAYIDSLGWAYYKKGLFDEALAQLKKAVKYLPDDVVIRDHLGEVYSAKGDLRRARKEWEEALKLDPDNPVINEKLNNLKTKR